MQVSLLSIIAVLGLATAAPGAVKSMEDLPDGPYKGLNNDDGSSTFTNLETGESFNIKADNESTANEKRSGISLNKRGTDCWGYQLDHGGVDQAVVQLKKWAGTGRDWSSGNKPDYFGYNSRGVYVYYCINAKHSSGNIDVTDIDYALGQMDAKCQRYEAGYYQWDGSPELIGKCRSGTQVCRG
ncbi:uncharacterized protein B0J16DRAFT_376673 [Fusarium flagelliforme]|uniref:Uncharacterized protein n=1 Tax=Fusarium flagelliforme TaxID=2675880 RepID=A0A395M750_9HYPO|nr:uncharacterized protein B0J16DRAFT_376673 [Fusarium flagelliforme]KAH7169781.1 hypothetical protein B0J16DRAFT_376673 [Fusarium flagelliforme]RFN43680.1 hypothetical protein FIE12Z_12084 [Fusarium flagelliforme]